MDSRKKRQHSELPKEESKNEESKEEHKEGIEDEYFKGLFL